MHAGTRLMHHLRNEMHVKWTEMGKCIQHEQMNLPIWNGCSMLYK
jgi:hypothetical protein